MILLPNRQELLSCCDGLHKIEMIWLAETRNKGFMRAFCFVSDDDFV